MKNKRKFALIFLLALILILVGITINYKIQNNLMRTITLYNAENYNTSTTITQQKGNYYTNLPTLEKENYIFIGWSTTENGDNLITSNTIVGDEDVIYPIFHLKSFTLLVDPNDGTFNSALGVCELNIDYNESKNIEEPTRVGYDFSGWNLEGNNSKIDNNQFTMGNEDAKLTATWIPKKYKLTMDLDGGVVDDKNTLEYDISYNDSIDLPIPQKKGYIFSGYKLDNDNISNSKYIMSNAKDAKLTATWTIKNTDQTVITYYIYNYLMDTNGTSYTLNSIDSNTSNLNDTISPIPRQYDGFTAPETKTVTIDEERNYYIEYKYTRNKYNLTINTNGGTYPIEMTTSLYYGESYKLFSPNKKGYNFINWTITNGTLTDNLFTMPINDTSITANYSPIKYNISYDLNGGTVDNLLYQYDISDVINLPKSTKNGYEFTGWSTLEDSTPVENMIIKNSTGNLNFIANYETAKYKVSLNDKNGNITNIKVEPNDPIGELPTPTKEGCEFIGWFTDISDGEQISSETIITSATTYYAHWKYYATGKVLSLADNNNIVYDNTSDNNLRYIGSNPNNYVKFNNEEWRIIGVMRNISSSDNTKSSYLKIIKSTSIGKYSWDSTASTINRGYGINEWSNSDLNTELNNYYYNSTSGNCDTDSQEVTTACDFSTTGLNDSAKNYIADVLWNTGTNGLNSFHFDSNGLASNFYNYERSNDTGKICPLSDTCNDTISRTTTWTGKIGLMYISDYGYAVNNNTCSTTPTYEWWNNSNCASNDWLSTTDEWTLSISSSNDYAYRVFYAGHNMDTSAASLSYDVRPTLYLKTDTLITAGNGSQSDPYILGQ